ncbi:hypothetical protein [Adlercreutzia sp. ZJ242]|uniref:hypothetical protein n=1 Tax=Adlercreutzia sp. ZJ242 TaxID=2709409 RepID=UPI001F152B06|nr:hypothetical protein [Adlercreutzia sp. ZJ242]
MVEGVVDLARARGICVRLFSYRKLQEWPPVVTANEGWNALYANQAESLNVLQNVDEAVEWANGLIERTDAAGA